MFGLRNQHGSCWLNAAIQGVLRVPELQTRFGEDEADTANPIEMCLQEIWGSKGEEGLKDFYECVKTATMPAGDDIGDSHELIQHLCDKIPTLDKLTRFKVANRIKCKNPKCGAEITSHDTMNEFSIAPKKGHTISQAISEAVTPIDIPDWKCEKCNERQGCHKQLLLAEFPKVLVCHKTSVGDSVNYTPLLVLNKHKYALISIVCYTGAHWFTFGRDLPPGKPWYRLDDTHVKSYDPNHYPQVDTMRLLMYYRLNE